MWQPSALQPPCPSSRSKSQYAAVGSTPSAKCLRAIVTECTTLPRLQPSAMKSQRHSNSEKCVRARGPVCGARTHARTRHTLTARSSTRQSSCGWQTMETWVSATSLLRQLHLLGSNAAKRSSSLSICCGDAHKTRIFHFNVLRIACVCARVCTRR